MGAQGKSVTDAGGAVVESVDVASKSSLDAWITAYNLSVTTVMPAQAGQQLASQRETVWIVDLCTMKIVYKTQGSLIGLGDSSVKTGISKILTLLK